LELDPTFKVAKGSESKQAKIQNDRDLAVLSVNYLIDNKPADSPSEEELIRNIQAKREEMNTDEKAVLIPFDDVRIRNFY
jgi:hypothetical protein